MKRKITQEELKTLLVQGKVEELREIMRFWGQIQLTPPPQMLVIFFPPSWRLFWLE